MFVVRFVFGFGCLLRCFGFLFGVLIIFVDWLFTFCALWVCFIVVIRYFDVGFVLSLLLIVLFVV